MAAPGIPICLGCAKPEHRDQICPLPPNHGPMDGPWRDDGSKPPILERCALCGGGSIAGLYLRREHMPAEVLNLLKKHEHGYVWFGELGELAGIQARCLSEAGYLGLGPGAYSLEAARGIYVTKQGFDWLKENQKQ